MTCLSRHAWAGLLLAVGSSGCQLVLGFESHELATGGAAAGGSGGAGGQGANGGSGGGVVFGAPEELASGLGAIDQVALDGADVIILEQNLGTVRLQRLHDQSLTVVADGLSLARGLVVAEGEAITTRGPSSAADGFCYVSAYGRAGSSRDILRDGCDVGENRFFAVATAGSSLAASFLQTQGNGHSDVRSGALSDSNASGTLIGLGTVESAGVPSIAIAAGKFFWLDSSRASVMASSGSEVTNVNNPPGPEVDVLAEALDQASELAIGSGDLFVTLAAQVVAIDAAGVVSEVTAADEPRGLSADAQIVAWAEPGLVRAYIQATGEVMTLDEPSDEPTDVAVGPGAVVYVTAAGRVVTIPRQ